MHLSPVDTTGWKRVLCVVAHPDDTEYGLSAAVATWTRQGIDVAYLLLTHGEAGMRRSPTEAGPLRSREQRHACDAVGVHDLTMLQHPDGALIYSLDLRRDIAEVIRRYRPHAVVVTNFDVEAYGMLNQADHRAAGLAALDATRDAANRWLFTEQIAAGLSEWQSSALLVYGDANPTHAVEVDAEAVQAAVASLQAHAGYLADLPEHPEPADFIPAMLAEGGKAAGTRHAVTFRVHSLGVVSTD